MGFHFWQCLHCGRFDLLAAVGLRGHLCSICAERHAASLSRALASNLAGGEFVSEYQKRLSDGNNPEPPPLNVVMSEMVSSKITYDEIQASRAIARAEFAASVHNLSEELIAAAQANRQPVIAPTTIDEAFRFLNVTLEAAVNAKAATAKALLAVDDACDAESLDRGEIAIAAARCAALEVVGADNVVSAATVLYDFAGDSVVKILTEARTESDNARHRLSLIVEDTLLVITSAPYDVSSWID